MNAMVDRLFKPFVIDAQSAVSTGLTTVNVNRRDLATRNVARNQLRRFPERNLPRANIKCSRITWREPSFRPS